MASVISHTPPWLNRDQAGGRMFCPKPGQAKPAADLGRRRTIATRDTEAFVAVGTEIRWADLAVLKEEWIESEKADRRENRSRYRTLRAALPLPITQLVVSPHGDYMAIATSHTVHIAVLPDSALLDSADNDPIRLRTFQVGPTAHVREESPVVSLIWHPLGYFGRCLVTVTRDGVVRLWEVNRSDRSTFSEPTLSIDLKKLANAENDKQNLSPSKLGASKGFSPDSFELEVASACFGDYPEQEGVHGWAPMTLWIAMVGGGLYALCPLLPRKWQLQESAGAWTLLETLATSINADEEAVNLDSAATEDQRETAQRQASWLMDIIYSEPMVETLPSGDSIKAFKRPASVPAVPLLQGPFSISSPDLEDFETSDIIVFSLKTFSESVDDAPAEGLPGAVVCLLTDTSKVHVCLDLLGVVGRWLPSSVGGMAPLKRYAHDLMLAETILLTDDDSPSFNQSITPDVQTDFSFFVSQARGTFYISLEPWIRTLESELAEPQREGLEFRLGRTLDSATSKVEQCMSGLSESGSPSDEVNACVVFADGNLGYFVLTTVENQPRAVVLDAPEDDGMPSKRELAEYMHVALPSCDLRAAYQPPQALYEPLHFITNMGSFVPARHKASSREQLRLSPANLDILVTAHKALSRDTSTLQKAVAELFVRCQRLQDEFRDQIFRVAQLVNRVDTVTGNDPAMSGSELEAYASAKIEERLDNVKAKQKALNDRYEAIRKKMASVGGARVTEKEAAFFEELQTLERSLESKAETLTGDQDGSDEPVWQRRERLTKLKEKLKTQVAQMVQADGQQPGSGVAKVPSHSRKHEQEEIDRLLHKEADLVESATDRLRILGISIPQTAAK
ncbi:hypothetical protein M011DRAFT_477316 [Sporormia fimetaria CBS 119925]|uniref:Nuclear pore complex protein An-Nup82 n=1 Tax=Sporormia fimetaria CBS 119925 TaxID=1340428 RepID=A0A6A6VDF3_9PLEO|nr:hypothetical protein M011DRAFT_477316 [Sporormia fimetaria CBS 119925]